MKHEGFTITKQSKKSWVVFNSIGKQVAFPIFLGGFLGTALQGEFTTLKEAKEVINDYLNYKESQQ